MTPPMGPQKRQRGAKAAKPIFLGSMLEPRALGV